MTDTKKIENRASSAGLGCMSVVGIVFVVLKLTGTEPVAGWSWWWVLSPFWLQFALGFVLITLMCFGLACFYTVKILVRGKDA